MKKFVCRAFVCLSLVLCFAPSALYARVLSIPAHALLPKDNGIAYDTNGVRMAVLDTGDRTFMAPVFLPNGAIITQVVLEARDPSGGEFGGHVKMDLVETRYNTFYKITQLDTGIYEAPYDTRIAAQTNHEINNAAYGYGLGVTINNGNGGVGNQFFYKAVIYYELNCPSDFNGDGDVDGDDLSVFSSDYGRTDCSP